MAPTIMQRSSGAASKPGSQSRRGGSPASGISLASAQVLERTTLPEACTAQHRPEAVCTMAPFAAEGCRWWRVQAGGWVLQPVSNTRAVPLATWAGVGVPLNG